MSSYDENIKIWKDAYTELEKVCEKYENFHDKYGFDDVRDMYSSAKNHLILIEWYEKYGLKLDHDHKPYTYNHLNLSDRLSFSHYTDGERDKANGSGKYISWSHDDRQPKDEWLLITSFSTGAYIFGQDYDGQQELFQDFFKELQSFKPDYSDIVNKSLYWKLENAKSIYEAYNGILNKYHERNQSELKKREAEKLREKLKELEASDD